MGRIESCDEKYATLFGGRPNSGEGNDPELLQILQRFIFGELSYTGPLDDRTRELVTCVVLATYQTLPQLKAHAGAALNVGVTPLELREAIYGCMPFIGCPKTLNAVGIIDEVFAQKGIALPLEPAATVADGERYAAGLAVQEPLYGTEIAASMASLPAPYDKAVPRFLTEWCFGDFSTRRGLDEKTRELLSLVILMALGGCDAQLAPHALGCVRAGNTVEEVYCAIVHAMAYTGIPRAFNAIYAVRGVLAEQSDAE